MKAFYIVASIILMWGISCGAQAPLDIPTSPAGVTTTTGLEFSAITSKTEYFPLEPIEVFLSITNASDVMQIIPTGRPELLYEIIIHKNDNVDIPLTRYGKEAYARSRNVQIKPYGIKPHDTYKEALLVNRYYDMSEAGTYLISLSRRLSVPGSSSILVAPSLNIELVITEQVPAARSAWGAR